MMLLRLNEQKLLLRLLVPNSYNMFIRLKKVKKRSGLEYEYAHLVHGSWKKRRLRMTKEGRRRYPKYNNSVHKYKGILGRVHRFDNNKHVSFEEFLGCSFEEFVSSSSVGDIYKKLIGYELFCCGFKDIKGVFHGGRLFVDLNRLVVHDGNSDVVIKLQDKGGYLCSLSLSELFDIQSVSGRYEGMLLMKKLRMAGVNIDPDNFFVLVNKMLED